MPPAPDAATPPASADDPLPRQVVRLDAPRRAALPVALRPPAAARAAIAAHLGIRALDAMAFAGTLRPEGRRDWRLDARLEAVVAQDCVVTLDPVTTRIEEDVARAYVDGLAEPEEPEAEMPEDDTAEPLPASLDLYAVAVEALALALPPFPRAPGVSLGEVVVTEPGAQPLTAEAARPFASLRDALKDRG